MKFIRNFKKKFEFSWEEFSFFSIFLVEIFRKFSEILKEFQKI